jgi:hypothetical protein
MIGIASIVPLVSVIAVAMINAHDIVAKESFRYAEELGERYASEIDAKFTEQLGAVRLLAGIFSSYRTIPPSFRRTIISAQVRSALDKSREVMAAWAQWEPGAIEDDPSPYSGTVFSTPNGGFDATWYHSPKEIGRAHV